MRRVGKLIFVFLCVLGPVAAEELESETKLQERPSVFLGPYNDSAIDHYYYGYPRSIYYPSLFSPLAYHEPLIPGRSSVSFAVGSDGYMGVAFSTTQPIRGTNVLFSLSSRWEEGDDWFFPGYRYSQHIISPRFSWSNDRTFISVGVDVGDYKFSKKEHARREQPRVDRMDPGSVLFANEDFSYENEIESLHVTLGHQLGNLAEIYFSASKDDWGNDLSSIGIRRRIYEGRNGRGEWFPPQR